MIAFPLCVGWKHNQVFDKIIVTLWNIMTTLKGIKAVSVIILSIKT